MFDQHIKNLQSSIQWAQQAEDLDILQLARSRMDQLVALISKLADEDRAKAYAHIDELLPMEWPLWMEACRYEDRCDNQSAEVIAIH